MLRNEQKTKFSPMNVTLKQLITPSIARSVLLISFTVPVWFVFLLIGHRTPDLHIEMFSIPDFFVFKGWLANVFSFVFVLLNAFLISQFNTRHSIIRTRTFMPVLVFIILMSVWEGLHNNLLPHAMLTLLIVSMFVFFNVYRSKHDAEMVFVSTLIMGIASFIVPALLYVLPVLWVGLFQFKSLSLRTWLGSVFGYLAPWVIYLSIKIYYSPSMEWTHELVAKFLFSMPQLLFHEYIYLAINALWLLLLLPALMEKYQGDSIQGRAHLRFLALLLLVSIILSMFVVQAFFFFLVIALLCFTLLFSHPLSLTFRNFVSIIFYLFVISHLLYLGYVLYFTFLT